MTGGPPICEKVPARDLHIGDWVHFPSGEQGPVSRVRRHHNGDLVDVWAGYSIDLNVPADYEYRVEVDV